MTSAFVGQNGPAESAAPRAAVRSRTGVLTADYPPGATFGPRTLLDHEFVWLTHGSARWTVESGDTSRSAELRPGMLALARPGQRDRFDWTPDRPSRHRYVHFRVGASPTAGLTGGGMTGPTTGPVEPRVRAFEDLPLLGALCDHLIELAVDGAGPGTAGRRRTDDLLAVLLDLFLHEPAIPGRRASAAGDADPLAPVWAAVTAAWSADGPGIVGVDRLAEAAGISRGHLFRLFRARFGLGPAQALERVRLARAATALQRSNGSLASIATATGFADPYHFSHRFSRVYGCPPGEFRRRGEDTDPTAPLREAGLLGVATRLG